MKYAFAYKALGSSPSEDKFDRHIRCGVGADESDEESSYSTGTVIIALIGGLVVGAVAMHFYMQPASQAPAFVMPPRYVPEADHRQDDERRVRRLFERSKAGHADAMTVDDQRALEKLYHDEADWS